MTLTAVLQHLRHCLKMKLHDNQILCQEVNNSLSLLTVFSRIFHTNVKVKFQDKINHFFAARQRCSTITAARGKQVPCFRKKESKHAI